MAAVLADRLRAWTADDRRRRRTAGRLGGVHRGAGRQRRAPGGGLLVRAGARPRLDHSGAARGQGGDVRRAGPADGPRPGAGPHAPRGDEPGPARPVRRPRARPCAPTACAIRPCGGGTRTCSPAPSARPERLRECARERRSCRPRQAVRGASRRRRHRDARGGRRPRRRLGRRRRRDAELARARGAAPADARRRLPRRPAGLARGARAVPGGAAARVDRRPRRARARRGDARLRCARPTSG